MPHPSLQSRVIHRDNAAHHGSLRQGQPTMLVIHASESDDGAEATMDYLNTTDEKTASYHYLIDRDGTIWRMTNPLIVAYHAGDSAWPTPKVAQGEDDAPNRTSVNRISIGIAWENNARNRPADQLTQAQLDSMLWLSDELVTDYRIPVDRVVGHNEVSPGRKVDPAPAIDMADFRDLLTRYREDA